MLLHFPLMHPELLPAGCAAALPAGCRFLNPGLAPAGSAAHFTPDSAPFDARTARALLADTLRYGESVADPRDIAPQALVQQSAGLDAEGSRAVKAEVERSILGAGQDADADPEDAARKQAQLLLLLAWSLEERLLDLRQAEERLRGAWSRLDQSVAGGEGLPLDDEADEDSMTLGRQLSGLTMPEEASAALPWRKLLECYALLAPEAALCTADAAIAAGLAEAGVPEGPLAAVPGALRVFRAPLWLLMGHDHAPAGRPWLARELTVGCLASGGAGEA